MSLILVVEQEGRYIERINDALSAEGWRVKVVTGHAEALQSAASEAPDLVVASADALGAEALASTFSRRAGGPGVVALLPEAAEGTGTGGMEADDLLIKPFTDDELKRAVRRGLAARRTGPAPAAQAGDDQKLTSREIFGDVLAEVEGELGAPAAAAASGATAASGPSPAVPARPEPRPEASRAELSRDDVQRKLEQTLSGVLGAAPRPKAPAPPAPPPRRPAEMSGGEVDALLSKTLSSLDLGARPAAKPRPAPVPAPAPVAAPTPPPPAAPAPPQSAAPPSAPVAAPVAPVAAKPVPPAAASPVALGEGTGVGRPKAIGDFDFSELEELARTRRRTESAPAGPKPVAPVPPAAASPKPAPPVAAVPPTPPAAARSVAPQAPASFPAVDAAATQRIPLFVPEEPGVPGERFGQYSLLDRIAVGGMAEVWKARMRGVEGFQKTVAIKKILPHMTHNAEFVGMFIDEAKLAAQLSHPNIIHIYDLGKIGSDYYIAMEYVEGKDLRSLLNEARHRRLPLPPGLALLIAARLASGLDYAHHKKDFEDRELGLVHRDVSPQNVLISTQGDVKLCDFGIAKAVSKASQTQMGALKGKLQYMSPEQAWGRPVDARSDIFSLGSLLFEMLTGERLFAGDSEISVLESVREGRIKGPRDLDPSVSPEVDAIVRRALALAPEDRFQTAGEMQQRIEAALHGVKPTPSHTDLAAYLHRLEGPVAEPAGPAAASPAAALPPAPAAPASPRPVAVAPPIVPDLPVPAMPEEVTPVAGIGSGMAPAVAPAMAAAMAPEDGALVEAVAPVGEVRGEEGEKKGRLLLVAAIAGLVVAGLLIYLFFGRAKGKPAPQEPPAAANPAQPGGASGQAPPAAAAVPAPAATVAGTAGAAGVQVPPDVSGLMEKELAKRESDLRKQLDKQLEEKQKELAKANEKKAAPVEEEPAPAASAPAVVAEAKPEPPPAPAPEPEPEETRSEPVAAAPAPVPEAPRVRVGELVEAGPGVFGPQLVSVPKAEYPPLARQLKVQGVVVVSVLVDENGRVQEARLLEPVKQKGGLNEAALKVARSAQYKPATKNGVRVKMWTRLRVPFKL